MLVIRRAQPPPTVPCVISVLSPRCWDDFVHGVRGPHMILQDAPLTNERIGG
jgi:hypothetical protein